MNNSTVYRVKTYVGRNNPDSQVKVDAHGLVTVADTDTWDKVFQFLSIIERNLFTYQFRTGKVRVYKGGSRLGIAEFSKLFPALSVRK